MQLFIKTISILAVSLLNISLSHASEVQNGCETQINCTVTNGNKTTTTSTGTRDDAVSSNRGGSGVTTTTTTTSNTYGGLGTAGSGVYEQAQQAQNKANMAMMAGLALAAAGLPRCGHPGGYGACIMGIAGLVAAGLAAGAAGKAQDLKNQLGSDGSGTPTTTTDSTTDTTGDVATAAAQVDQLKADYAKKGYKINPDGSTTLPNGKTIDSNFSPSSMAAAGLSAADINKVTAGLGNLNKPGSQASTNAEGLSVSSADRGNGMIQGQVGTGPGASGYGNNGDASGVQASNIDRDPAAWAGFYKRFGDSIIGVPQTDIFLLIENRVEKERKIMGQ
jgi:hypothetical protein